MALFARPQNGPPPQARLVALVSGHVQGVGFRFTTSARGTEFGLVGSAINLPDGRVEVSAEGSREACERLLAWLRSPAAPGRVTDVDARWLPPTGRARRFTIG